ncbi:unnamed protein product [Leptosia nina]|uniref:Major facilitator superfamily (MFS) profile domain-containing protein n=1 Tax=Leptosia nina TaxID=320188 RepID=A0AAV1JDH3_9NEOP
MFNVKIGAKNGGTGHIYWQWTYSGIASLGFLIYGVESGWLSPFIQELKSLHTPLKTPVDDTTITWWASILPMSGIFFVLLFSHTADVFGRKWSLIIGTLPEIVSIIIRLAWPTPMFVIVARIFSGISAAAYFVIIPVYIREISEDGMLGRLGSLPILSQNVGFLVVYAVGAFFNYFTVLWIILFFPIIMALLMLSSPESPSYLVKRNKINEAIKSIAFLRGLAINDEKVVITVQHMQYHEEGFKNMSKISMITILRDKPLRKGVCLILLILATHSWNGAFAIVTYASAVMLSTGTELNISPELQTISLPIVMIIASLTLTSIAEKFGRRHIQAVAYLTSGISLAILAVFILLQDYVYSTPPWLPLTCMIVIAAMYAGGIRPLPFVVATEMFQFQVRAKIMGCLTVFVGLMNSTHLYAYTPIKNTFGLPATFLIFALYNIIGVISSLLLPETRGKSEEEIREELENKFKIRL